MAIPPITNNPFLKLSGADRTGETAQQKQDAQTPRASTPQDIVDISRAAQQRLDGVKILETEGQAREAAGETRDILKTAPYALGGGFSV